jgi:hypothetical protein
MEAHIPAAIRDQGRTVCDLPTAHDEWNGYILHFHLRYGWLARKRTKQKIQSEQDQQNNDAQDKNQYADKKRKILHPVLPLDLTRRAKYST